jgi:hypothetical protein
MVPLETDSPLLLSFMVCGSREGFEALHLKIKLVSCNGAGAQLTPRLNSSLVRDSNAERYGISVTLLNATSPRHEMCNEVLVRVWTDHSSVHNSTIELLLNIKPDGERFPQTFEGGSYFLHLPGNVTTVPTPVVMNTTGTTVTTRVAMNTTVTTVNTVPTAQPEHAGATSITQLSIDEAIPSTAAGATVRTTIAVPDHEQSGIAIPAGEMTPTDLPTIVLSNCAGTITVMICAVLGSFLIVAMVIIIMLLTVMWRIRVKNSKGHLCEARRVF